MGYDLLLVAVGLVLLFVGGEGLVRGAVAIAERFGISKLLIGLVIVGFGTSTPELLVSVNAALDGAPEIALGNVVGSNIANILLIIGIAAAITPVTGWDRGALFSQEAYSRIHVCCHACGFGHSRACSGRRDQPLARDRNARGSRGLSGLDVLAGTAKPAIPNLRA